MKFIVCPQSRPLSQTLISVDREMVPRRECVRRLPLTRSMTMLTSFRLLFSSLPIELSSVGKAFSVQQR
jgi:hypothetical protein